MSCQGCPSILALFRDANLLAPHRSRLSDGICASSAHTSQNPLSDHEPDSRGLAHAGDLTHDPPGGWDCERRVRELVARRDYRVKYIIWNGGIWRSYDKPGIPAWTRSPYTGSNTHSRHMHVSVYTLSENDESPWWEIGDWFAMATEADLERVVRRVVQDELAKLQAVINPTADETLVRLRNAKVGEGVAGSPVLQDDVTAIKTKVGA